MTGARVLLRLDLAIRTAAENPADGRSIEDIMTTVAILMREGQLLADALCNAADPRYFIGRR